MANVQYCIALHVIELNCIISDCFVLDLLDCIALYFTVSYCIALCFIVLRCAALLYCVALYDIE